MVSLQFFSVFLKLLDLLSELGKLIFDSLFSFRGFTLGCFLRIPKLIFQSLLFSLEFLRLVFSTVKLVLNLLKISLVLLASSIKVSLQSCSIFLKLLDLLSELGKLILESLFSFRGCTLGCFLRIPKLIFHSLLFGLELLRLVFSIVKLLLDLLKIFLVLLVSLAIFVTRITFAVRIT